MIDLPSESEVKVLFFIAGGHDIADFRVGKEGKVGFEVLMGADVLVEGGDGHVESDVFWKGQPHGFVGQADIREGRVEGVVIVEKVEVVGVECGSVEVMMVGESDGVEVGWIEGYQGGVGALLLS